MKTKIQSLERQIVKIKSQITALDDIRPGSLSQQYSVCGKSNCRCNASPPQKHGPYYQVSFGRKGKSGSRFVREEELPAIKKQLANYVRMRKLVDRWIELATELSDLKLEKFRGKQGRGSRKTARASSS